MKTTILETLNLMCHLNLELDGTLSMSTTDGTIVYQENDKGSFRWKIVMDENCNDIVILRYELNSEKKVWKYLDSNVYYNVANIKCVINN